MTPLLQVSDLRVRFEARRGAPVQAVAGLSYELEAGRTLAIIGESGSGKTVSSRAIMGLLPDYAQVTGSARLDGTELIGLNDGEMRRHRGADVAMVFQDPARSLNPTMRVGTQITEAVNAHADLDKARRARAGARAAGARPAAGGRAALRRVPPSAVGRHAPAGHDRHRAGLAAPAAHRRRGDHGARRHHAGADHGAAARAAGEARHGARDDQPRPRARRELRGRGDRHVRGPCGRAGADARAVPQRAHAVHEGPAGGDPPARAPAAHDAARRAGPAAGPHPLGAGCPFEPRCPDAQEDCREDGAAAHRARAVASLRLLAPGARPAEVAAT